MNSDEHDEADRPAPGIDDALAALKRARLRAEAVAAATDTDLVFERNGRLVRVRPNSTRAKSA